MASLEKTVIELRQKKKEATKLKQKAEEELKQLQSAEKRSATGLQKMIKKIESEKEDVSDVSENLTRKNAQVESIERLVATAEERVNSEKEAIERTEQELEFADTPEEKNNAEARLRSLNDHVQELISEINSRRKTLKKITGEVTNFDDIKSKITTQIKKQTKSKPSLRSTISSSHKNASKVVKEIEKRTKISFSRQDVPTGMDICKTRLLSLIDKVENVKIDEQQIAQFMPDIYKKLEWLERDELIKHFVSTEFNRYLSYYKNARDINISKNSKSRDKKRHDNPNRKDRDLASFAGYYINIGFQSKMNPGRLMGLINECLRSSNAAIGNIEIMKTFSFFEIEEEYEDKLIQSFKGKKFAGISIQIEKDTGSGKRSSESNQKSRRRNRQKNKKVKRNNRSRRR